MTTTEPTVQTPEQAGADLVLILPDAAHRPDRWPDAASTPASIRASASTTPDWHSLLVLEDSLTADHRIFAPGALTTRRLPLPFMALTETTSSGHDKARLAGALRTAGRDGQHILGDGVYDLNGSIGAETARLVRESFLRWVSVDTQVFDYEITTEDGSDIDFMDLLFGDVDPIFTFLRANLIGVTAVPFPDRKSVV